MITLFHDMQLSESGRKAVPSAEKKKKVAGTKRGKKGKRPRKTSI